MEPVPMEMANLGPRDEQRFRAISETDRENLAFKVDFCMNVLQKRPLQPETLRVLADALTILGYYEDGLIIDRRLSRLSPDDETVHYNLACSLALTGQADDALQTLQKAIDLGYADSAQMRNDPDLQSLRGMPRFRELLQQCRVANKTENAVEAE